MTQMNAHVPAVSILEARHGMRIVHLGQGRPWSVLLILAQLIRNVCRTMVALRLPVLVLCHLVISCSRHRLIQCWMFRIPGSRIWVGSELGGRSEWSHEPLPSHRMGVSNRVKPRTPKANSINLETWR